MAWELYLNKTVQNKMKLFFWESFFINENTVISLNMGLKGAVNINNEKP